MFQAIKVWLFRMYYRFSSARCWKGQLSDIPWGALEIPSRAGPIRARLYNAGGDKPVIIYFHGGGWVIGDLDTHHPFCLALSEASGCCVIAVAYRLAPEHPFPAGPDDCLAAVRWIAHHIGDFGPSNGRLVLGGDSAGGNLAACTYLALDNSERAQVAGAFFLYPATDHYSTDPPSYTEHATGQMLTSKIVYWFWNTYLGWLNPEAPEAQRAFPLRSADLASVPPTFLVTAEFDPLRDEGVALAEKLREAGVPVQYRHFDTAAHGFACSEGRHENFREFMRDLTAWLDKLPAA